MGFGASAAAIPQKQLEDPLEHLPSTNILAFQKGRVIYDCDEPATSLYLVIDGKVKVCRTARNGGQLVVDIYRTDEFFGESAFLGLPARNEEARAIENTKLMAWSTSALEEVVMQQPRLAVALIQILVQRSIGYGRRIESFAVDGISRRVADTLVRFSDRFGKPAEDGCVRMMPFTHELLSQYVGTSRELVTQCMNQFRRQGYVRYSRQCILLHRDALNNWLEQPWESRRSRGNRRRQEIGMSVMSGLPL